MDMPDEEGRFTIEATADTNATLGYYKTGERAKEVLKEIATCYTGDGELYNQGYVVYEMPEE